MTSYDANTAQCWVYSYKEGLLSRIAHDLKHRVSRFSLQVDELRRVIEAEVDARSLRVECVMKDGVEAVNDDLSDDHKEEIEMQILSEVLDAEAHPRIRFQSTDVTETREGYHILGNLTLAGRTQPVVAVARRVGPNYEAEMVVHQPSFGIKPFSSLMGTLKIRPEVLVRMIVPIV